MPDKSWSVLYIGNKTNESFEWILTENCWIEESMQNANIIKKEENEINKQILWQSSLESLANSSSNCDILSIASMLLSHPTLWY